MKWLVLVHVLSAIVGLGPAFAFPFLLWKRESVAGMEESLRTVTRLELFPKLFGTLAVLSGVLLLLMGSYGGWLQMWIVGTLAIYVLVEVLVVGFLNPASKRLLGLLAETEAKGGAVEPGNLETPQEASVLYTRVRWLHAWASALCLVIFALMILKPH
ncbi:DUF2269 family protein [Paenibacillus cymbidii]|uniref:DUF2269 family protein n=1 Tax=Paenibacillus cymbidii TaxID=1639034 RepID=UPI0010800B64|nr:DUF2269 family protein [Paenibacillus cymbidii]